MTVVALLAVACLALAPRDVAPRFELIQPELFGATGGQPNAWADFDNDGDLDEFVGFRGRPNRLYRQDHGRFEDVAAAVGLADQVETRAAAWGDFDGDGHLVSTSASSTALRTSCIRRARRSASTRPAPAG